jgi:hypothetical protein
MRCFLINKNLSLYYWLRKKIGKKWACKLAITLEKGILILGRPKTEDCSSVQRRVKLGTSKVGIEERRGP